MSLIKDKDFHLFTSKEVQSMSDADLVKRIGDIAQHKALLKGLSEADLANLAAYIKSLKK